MTASDYERVGRAVEHMRSTLLVGDSVADMLRLRVKWCSDEGVPTGWLELFVEEWDKVEKLADALTAEGGGE